MNKTCLAKLLTLLILVTLPVNLIEAQSSSIDDKLLAETIQKTLRLLADGYVSPETAKLIEQNIREREKRGE